MCFKKNSLYDFFVHCKKKSKKKAKGTRPVCVDRMIFLNQITHNQPVMSIQRSCMLRLFWESWDASKPNTQTKKLISQLVDRDFCTAVFTSSQPRHTSSWWHEHMPGPAEDESMFLCSVHLKNVTCLSRSQQRWECQNFLQLVEQSPENLHTCVSDRRKTFSASEWEHFHLSHSGAGDRTSPLTCRLP